MPTPAHSPEPEILPVPSGTQSETTQGAVPRLRGPSATRILIVSNTLIFSAMLVASLHIGGTKKFLNTRIAADFDSYLLLTWGSNYGPFTLSGQFWRLITSIFLHLNVVHLLTNMLFLWGLGRHLDRLLDRTQALAIYLLTGAAASVFSLYWHPLINAAGASGAIYGRGGVLLALLCFARLDLPRRTIIRILIWLLFLTPIELLWSHLSKHTDYAAHVGGALSGLLMGAVLARTFRLSDAERAARQRRLLRFATVTLVVAFALVTQASRSEVMIYADLVDNLLHLSSQLRHGGKPRISRVFLDVQGDPKLVHRLSTFLNLELEDAGIAVADSEREADGVLRAKVRALVKEKSIGFVLMRMQITAKSGVTKMDSCEFLRTDENGDFFDYSAADAARNIRAKYPDARTVGIDPASNMAASKQFVDKFPNELKTAGLTVAATTNADISLRMSLVSRKVPVEEDLAAYDIKVVASNGDELTRNYGTGVLFAKLVQEAPAACPHRFDDLKWLYRNDPLLEVAKQMARDLQERAK